MRILRVIAAALPILAAALTGCSGGGEDRAARFEVPTPTPGAGTRAPQVSSKLKPPPPARMFAGTHSSVGELARYCKGSSCTEERTGSPGAFVEAPTGAFVVFSLGETPLEAVAEVRVKTGEQPGIVRLNPNTLMVFNHGLGRGKYLVDLVVRWRASEARWRFGLTVI